MVGFTYLAITITKAPPSVNILHLTFVGAQLSHYIFPRQVMFFSNNS